MSEHDPAGAFEHCASWRLSVLVASRDVPGLGFRVWGLGFRVLTGRLTSAQTSLL